MAASDRSFVASRQVGAAVVTIISDGTGRWAPQLSAPEAEWRRAMPEADANGALELEFNVAHVALGNASILIDLGFDDLSPASQWRPPAFARTAGVEAGLAQIDVRPEDISHVLITHAHGDHIAGGIVERDGARHARFPRARHIINRRDVEQNPAMMQPGSLAARHLGGLRDLGLLDLVDGDHAVVPGVTLIHAPGESPGHSIVRIASQGEEFFYVGDLFHHPCEVANLDWVSPGRDAAAASASRERLIRDALATGGLVAFAHARLPAWGRITREGGRAAWHPVA